MSTLNYWTRLRHHKISRRTMLGASAKAGVGAAGLALVGCGGDDDDDGGAGDAAAGAALASDAFFPFPDSLEVAAAAGVTAAVHPGGSIRDEESVETANRLDLALLTTGARHFRH